MFVACLLFHRMLCRKHGIFPLQCVGILNFTNDRVKGRALKGPCAYRYRANSYPSWTNVVWHGCLILGWRRFVKMSSAINILNKETGPSASGYY